MPQTDGMLQWPLQLVNWPFQGHRSTSDHLQINERKCLNEDPLVLDRPDLVDALLDLLSTDLHIIFWTRMLLLSVTFFHLPLL